MIDGKTIAVVVPARDEARHVGHTLATLPAFVDCVVLVDDASRDGTAGVARGARPDVVVVAHPVSRGVGAAIVSGYREALVRGADVVAVMAGDGQMHPDDLLPVLAPVVAGRTEYAKGNRFGHPDTRRAMPWVRRAGGTVLAHLTSMATGYPIRDSQTGFTAIDRGVLERLDLDRLWPGYGYPNDLLSLLSVAGARVEEVVVRPVYQGQRSGLRPRHFAVMLGLILRAAIRRRIAPSRPGAPARPTCA